MQTRSHKLLAAAGAAALAAFFLPFLDLAGLVQASGWDIVTADGTSWTTRLLFAALPLGGLTMLVGGLSGGRRARLAGAAFGLGVFGYLGFQLVRAFVATTGLGLWLTMGAAALGLAAALSPKRA